MQLLILYVFAALLGSAAAQENPIHTLFKTLFRNDRNKCWQRAVNDLPDTETENLWEKRLVNVYTQDCNPYEKQLNNSDPFYARLNRELREKNKTVTGQWKTTETLLNSALDTLGIQTYDLLYRGCHCDNLTEGHTIRFDGFTSTSTSRTSAARFLLYHDVNDVYMKFENTRGTPISKYSDSKHEAEVLLKSGREFKVVTVIKKPKNIETELNWMKLIEPSPLEKVRIYTILKPITAGRRRRHSSQIDSCSCSKRSPDNDTSSSTKNGLTCYLLVLILCVALPLYE